jgi:hypothetical protein
MEASLSPGGAPTPLTPAGAGGASSSMAISVAVAAARIANPRDELGPLAAAIASACSAVAAPSEIQPLPRLATVERRA